MDIAAINGLIGSLRLATDLTKQFLKIKTTAEIQSLVIALQGEILSAQSSALTAQSDHAAMAESVRTLKEEVTRIKAWNKEKKRYALVKMFTGSVTYALKEECKGTEPPHWICTKCFEDGFKSILNPRKNSEETLNYECPRCNASITSDYDLATSMNYAQTK